MGKARTLRWRKSKKPPVPPKHTISSAPSPRVTIRCWDAGGINVSGGQKQRICIARALLRKPKILILDDSTSAVDTETELKIRNNLNAMLHDTTVFIITQRINTMQSADRVIVLEDGEINAIGTPDELIKRSTVYQEIYHSQQVLF